MDVLFVNHMGRSRYLKYRKYVLNTQQREI